ncbi:hypothetical protein DNHGIG_37590 [Collibacillus ludicampi]|jgi:hypothetical protein|uniref:YIEGIA protein n=2 Tax=Collibacillus ludicampi TaxID=2771369 RepID=A0AAV4LKC5_9BACL|nr:hypothetical protein DNHGIG_37590 [Collibacillus ludicampi]
MMQIDQYTRMIIVGTILGVFSRLYMLRTDYRYYPTYPHGRVIHIALGVIASGLGAVAVPSLLKKDYTAITFLTLAASQFREVRNMERQMLSNVDQMELVPRGVTYIEGIAMVFEGRNYLVIFTSFLSSLFTYLLHWWGGILAGVITIFVLSRYMSGKTVQDFAKVREGKLYFKGPYLMVDDIVIMNIGLKDTRERILKHGIGIVVEPNNPNGRTSFAHLGQRQSILHDVSTILGVYRDSGEPSLVPLAKRDLETGNVGFFLLPLDKDPKKAIEIIKKSPMLESSLRKPLQADVKPDRHMDPAGR